MALKLPFYHDWPEFRYTISLEGVQYDLRCVYRSRTASWYLDLFAADGTALIRGRRLSPAASPHAGLITDGPPGALVPVGADPYARAELELWYLTVDDLIAFRGEVAPGLPVELA